MLTQAMLTFLTVGRKASRSASTIIIVNVSKMPHSRRIGFIVFSSFQLLKVRRDNAQVHLTDVALYSTCSHFQLIPAGCRYQNHPLWRRTQQKLTPFYLYLLLHFFTLNQARKKHKNFRFEVLCKMATIWKWGTFWADTILYSFFSSIN